jgi:hypothetical protein
MKSTLEQAIADLAAMGLHRDLITRAVGRDPGLVVAVARFARERIRDNTKTPIVNAVGFVLTCFRDPQRFGLTRLTNGCWQVPGTRRRPSKKRPPETLAERMDRIAAERERWRREAQDTFHRRSSGKSWQAQGNDQECENRNVPGQRNLRPLKGNHDDQDSL